MIGVDGVNGAGQGVAWCGAAALHGRMVTHQRLELAQLLLRMLF